MRIVHTFPKNIDAQKAINAAHRAGVERIYNAAIEAARVEFETDMVTAIDTARKGREAADIAHSDAHMKAHDALVLANVAVRNAAAEAIQAADAAMESSLQAFAMAFADSNPAEVAS